MHGRRPSILWAWPYHFVGVFSSLSAIRRQFCIEKSRWEFEFCPLSGIKKRPLLGGCFSITTMLISLRNTELVRCREVVIAANRLDQNYTWVFYAEFEIGDIADEANIIQ